MPIVPHLDGGQFARQEIRLRDVPLHLIALVVLKLVAAPLPIVVLKAADLVQKAGIGACDTQDASGFENAMCLDKKSLNMFAFDVLDDVRRIDVGHRLIVVRQRIRTNVVMHDTGGGCRASVVVIADVIQRNEAGYVVMSSPDVEVQAFPKACLRRAGSDHKVVPHGAEHPLGGTVRKREQRGDDSQTTSLHVASATLGVGVNVYASRTRTAWSREPLVSRCGSATSVKVMAPFDVQSPLQGPQRLARCVRRAWRPASSAALSATRVGA